MAGIGETTTFRRAAATAAAVALGLAASLSPAGAPAPGAANAAPAAPPGGDGRGGHVRPVPGAVLRPFDPPEQPWLPGHRGVDLGAAPGAPVRASAGGRVHFAGSVAGRPTVSVMHAGGLRTTYQPVAASVAAGEAVARGQIIGVLVRWPEPGLHWGALRGDDYVNPLDLLGRRTVVLKPARTFRTAGGRAGGSP